MRGAQHYRQSDPAFVAQLQERAEAVRARLTLSDVIGADISLRRSGREMTGLCPFHAEKSDGAFMVNDAKGLYKCFSCGATGDAFDYAIARMGFTFMQALAQFEADAGIDFRDAKQKAELDVERERRKREADDKAKRRAASAWNMWRFAARGMDTPAQLYLEGRGIDFRRLGHFPGAIRFGHQIFNAQLSAKIPAMLTAIQMGARTVAVHRTYLAYERGRWIKDPRLEKSKMVLGEYYGGAMPLWKGASKAGLADMPAGQGVALSEGIEDGLTVAMECPEMRVLAGVSLDNIGNVQLPPQAGDVTILCQNDYLVRDRLAAQARAAMMAAGLAGDLDKARELDAAALHHDRCAADIGRKQEVVIGKLQAAAQADGSGRQVRLAWPGSDFKDFNDELTGKRMEGV